MRQPGVEVRPLKQITGHSLFSEVFMTNARVEKSDLIGKINEGWAIAQTTLGFERGGNSLGRVTRYAIAFSQLVKPATRWEPMVELTHVCTVPEESASKYWCTSKAK